MDFEILLVIMFVEFALLLSVAVIYFIYKRYSKNKKAKQNNEQKSESLEELLEKEIKNTRYIINTLSRDSVVGDKLYRCCESRIKILENEKKIVTEGYQDKDRYWELVNNYLNFGNDSSSQMVETLRKRLAVSDDRIRNLEKFKELFIGIKSKWEQSRETIEKLSALIQNEKNNTGNGEEVSEILCGVENISDELSRQIKRIEEDFNSILHEIGEQNAEVSSEDILGSTQHISESSRKIAFGVSNLKNIITSKNQKIEELIGKISSLEIEADQLGIIMEQVETIREKNNELENVMYILEDENRFLQKQLQELIQGEMVTEKEYTERMKRLEQEIASREEQYAEMEQKYAEMETLYLDACEKAK